MKILLVEDNNLVKGEIEKNLKLINIDSSIDHVTPTSDGDIVDLLPSKSQLNKYDLALVDLELAPFKNKRKYVPDDLAGGTQVLPYLRKNAPWLPVIAESRLFSSEAEYFLAIAGSFGFDGYIPNELFASDSFTRDRWDIICSNASFNRRSKILSHNYAGPNNKLEIVVPRNCSTVLDKQFPSWKSILFNTFYFADKISLTPIGEGFSGAITLRAKIIKRDVSANSKSEWLVKISNNPFKLTEELNAHLSMMINGIEFARSVPLLWRGIVVEKGVGCIAYQFAPESDVALAHCSTFASAIKLVENISGMLSEMYSNALTDDETVINLLQQWFSTKRIEYILNHTQDKLFKSDLQTAIANTSGESSLFDVVTYKHSWIHGDLHLRNILIGPRNVFIDFARSKPGPVILDLAKFTADILLHLSDSRSSNFPSFESIDSPINEIIAPIKAKLLLEKNDIVLYDIFLRCFLLIAVDFPDISNDAKEWVNGLNI